MFPPHEEYIDLPTYTDLHRPTWVSSPYIERCVFRFISQPSVSAAFRLSTVLRRRCAFGLLLLFCLT